MRWRGAGVVLAGTLVLAGCGSGDGGDDAGGSDGADGGGGGTDGSTVEAPGQVIDAAAASITPASSAAGTIVAPCHERLCAWDVGGSLVADDWVADDADVTATAWSADGATLAVAAAGPGQVLLLDGTTGEEITAVDVPGTVAALAFDPVGPRLAVGTADGVTVLDVTSPEETLPDATVTAVTGDVVDLAYTADGGRLAVAYADTAPQVHDASTYAELLTLGDAPALRVSWDDAGDRLATAGPDGATVVGGADGEVVDSWDDAEVTDVAFEPGAAGTSGLALATADNRVLLWQPGGEATALGEGVAPTRALLWSGGLYGAADDVVSKWRTEASPRSYDLDLPPFD